MKLRVFMSDTMQPAKGAMKVSTKGIIEGYRERYDALIKRPEAKFQVQTYKVSPNHQIMVHVKVPSETVNKLHYDVLLALSPEKGTMDLLDCDVKIFSNCPSFVYSVAYIFAHWDPDAKAGTTTAKGKGMMIDTLKGKLPRDRMLIPGTEKKLGKQPVHDPPVVRNPLGLPLFDKSIYYAIFYLQDNVPYDQIIRTHNNVSMARVVASVEDFERLMSYRRKLEQDQKRQKALQQNLSLVIAVNKWDAVEKDGSTMTAYRKKLEEDFSFMSYADILFISAVTGQRLQNLFTEIDKVRQSQTLRVQTGVLNEIITEACALKQPPSDKGKRLRIYYTTQVGQDYSQDRRVFPESLGDGQYLYTLPRTTIVALRLDPCSPDANKTVGLTFTPGTITLNAPETLPAVWQYFVPNWYQAFCLVLYPALAAAAFSWLRAVWRTLLRKTV